jgi:maltose O-acetyltransferase
MHITILDGATIVDGSRILCHDASSYRRIGATWVAPVVIGHRAFVGADSIVMPGVTVGDDAIIAAGAVVTQDVPAGVVVAGVPARVVGLTADVDARRVSMMGGRPCFDESVYNRADLDPDRLTELHDAASEGGYFLVRTAQHDRTQ